MIKIKGIEIQKESLQLTKLGDLLAFEGPILSHFISPNGDDYFFFWVDHDDQLNRWVVCSVSNEQMLDFFENRITLRELILSNPNGFVWLIEINHEIKFEHIFVVSNENIPKSYLPSKDAIFSAEGYEPYAYRLKNYIQQLLNRASVLSSISKAQVSYQNPVQPNFGYAKESKSVIASPEKFTSVNPTKTSPLKRKSNKNSAAKKSKKNK